MVHGKYTTMLIVRKFVLCAFLFFIFCISQRNSQ
nr:MAG TPA: hypothetical protein [Caudoviricetes sp.]